VDGEEIAMIRATGFLLGALLMLAVFLFVFGDGLAPSPLPLTVSHAVETEPLSSVPAAAGNVSADIVDGGSYPVNDVAGPGEESQLEAVDGVPDVAGSGLELDPQSLNESLVAYQTVSRNGAMSNDTMEASRYRVWTPFHSKWAAEGFAQRLSQATDVPVEVINEEPGIYQVVFSYRDDGERQAMVEKIETVTGLELE